MTDTVITTIWTIGDGPCALIYNHVNNKVYCANQHSDTVHVIHGYTNSIIAAIPVGNGPCAFTWNPVQNRTYVANWYGSSISVIRDSGSDLEELSKNAATSFLHLSQNPVSTLLKIEAPVPMQSIEVCDVLGKLVRKEEMPRQEYTTTISAKNLSAGVYFIKVNTEETVFVEKVIVTK
jgi:YVTN family beta-propeller protein